MKNLILLISTFLTVSLFANQDIPNLTGEWKGFRFQFNESKSAYIAEFQYTYTLTQEGNQVKGIAKITKEDSYAEIAVRGFVEGSKFYFEEYEVLNAKRREGFLWCLKKGVLDIHQTNNRISISGTTPSFVEVYGVECSGGVTLLSKEVKRVTQEEIKEISKGSDLEKSLNVHVYPNPYVDQINLAFNLSQRENVLIDVVDIQGRVVLNLENRIMEAGEQFYTFVPSPDETTSYFYVRVKIGNQTISKAIQKVSIDGEVK